MRSGSVLTLAAGFENKLLRKKMEARETSEEAVIIQMRDDR